MVTPMKELRESWGQTFAAAREEPVYLTRHGHKIGVKLTAPPALKEDTEGWHRTTMVYGRQNYHRLIRGVVDGSIPGVVLISRGMPWAAIVPA